MKLASVLVLGLVGIIGGNCNRHATCSPAEFTAVALEYERAVREFIKAREDGLEVAELREPIDRVLAATEALDRCVPKK